MTRPVGRPGTLPENLRIPESLRRSIVDHCLSASPNEGCGLFAVDDGRLVEVYRTANAAESPTGYTVPPEEHLRAIEDAESRGWEIGGVFHSHPTGTARPSMVDVNNALDPSWIYLVVGLAGEPELRAWRIGDGDIEEVTLT